MRVGIALGLLVATVSLWNCGSTGPARGADLSAGWEVLRNYTTDQGARFEAELTLTNQGSGTLPASGWSLYFNTLAGIQPIEVPESIELVQINGGFYRLRPASGFGPLPPGESVGWKLILPGWSVSEADAPSGIYLVYHDAQGAEREAQALPPIFVRPFVTEAQTRRSSMDRIRVPTPQLRFEANRGLSLLPREEYSPIIPTPVWLQTQAGEWTLTPGVEIHHGPGLEFEAQYLAEALGPLLGRTPSVGAGLQSGTQRIVLRTSDGKLETPNSRLSGGASDATEAYRLSIGAGGVEIVGGGAAGVFYGVQSFRALLPVEAYARPQDQIRVAGVRVEDAPRFAYRGMHLDVARNFQPKSQVLKFLDLMSFYKLNKFHFHFTDDEGWRWAVDGLSELTDVGGRRGHTSDERDRLVPSYGSGPFPDPNLSSGSGWYSRQDLVEILRYAHQRHIEVIPEIDVPGHARAAIVAMKARAARLREQGDEAAGEFHLVHPEDLSQYRSIQGWNDNVVDVCQESTYRFLGKVFDELKAIHQQAGAPLKTIQIGGDEVPHGVWEGSPACRELIESRTDGVEGVEDLPRYFVRRLSGMLAERGLKTGGWEEIALERSTEDIHGAKTPNLEFVDRGFQVYAWNSIWGELGAENAYKLANAGYSVILCNASNLYFDLAYNKDPQELGQAWAGYINTRKPYEFVPLDYYRSARQDFFGNPIAPESLRGATRLTAAGRANILGIQGQLWSEALTSREKMEYMAFPKLLALSERAWSPHPDWARLEDREESDRFLAVAWNAFANSLGQRELPRLNFLNGGVNYRIPLPGAVIEGGRLQANIAFPGLQIRYTTDGSEPTANSPLYTGPADATGPVKLKAFDSRGRGSRTSTVH